MLATTDLQHAFLSACITLGEDKFHTFTECDAKYHTVNGGGMIAFNIPKSLLVKGMIVERIRSGKQKEYCLTALGKTAWGADVRKV